MRISFLKSFLLVFFLGIGLANGQAQERIRVHILSKYSLREIEIRNLPDEENLEVQIAGMGLRVRGKEGEKLVPALEVDGSPEKSLLLAPEKGLRRAFQGRLKVFNRQGHLFFIQELPLEDYVTDVLASEMPADAPIEALKAQAVLIRTYALSQRPRHGEDGFDFCDLTHCQVFAGGGRGLAYPAAVAATAGLLLSYEGKPAEALFHSACGGHTSPNQRVFGGRPVSYLQGVDDENFCRHSSHEKWETRFSLGQIGFIFQGEGETALRGALREVTAKNREPGGRWFSLDLVGENRVLLSAEKFLSRMGKEFGWHRLKSAWFEVEVKDGEAIFRGRGLGHGVGFCQEGAMGRARAGQSFREILSHYFPGTRLTRLGS
jgi:stage II sporulation protein D